MEEVIDPVRKNVPFDETRACACIEDCNETCCGSPGYSDISVDLVIPFGHYKDCFWFISAFDPIPRSL